MVRHLLRLGTLAALVVATSFSAYQPAPAYAEGVGEAISRSEVIARAHYWNALNVPYNQGAYRAGPGESRKYRTDCSGFVSMAWHLPESRWTGSLDDVSTVIKYSALRPGDILMRDKDQASGHVVIFERWTDSSKSAMWILEQASRAADMNYRKVSVSDRRNAGYIAYKYKKILDDKAGTKGSRGTGGARCHRLAGQEINLLARRDVYFEAHSCLVRSEPGPRSLTRPARYVGGPAYGVNHASGHRHPPQEDPVQGPLRVRALRRPTDGDQGDHRAGAGG